MGMFSNILAKLGFGGDKVEAAKAAVRRSNTTIATLMVHLGDADAMSWPSWQRWLQQAPRSSTGKPPLLT